METLKTTLSKAADHIKQQHQLILSTLLILLTITIIYHRDFEILANEALHTESSTHIILIPFFTAYLLYKQKNLISATLSLEKHPKKPKYINEVIGVALCLVAFLLYWYGSYTFNPLEIHLLSLPIFIAGTTVILFNLKILRIILFPIIFLLFLVPPPTDPIYTLGSILANFNTQASYTIMHTIGLPVTLQTSYGPPTIALATPNQPIYFTIDLPCSGIYSLIAFIMFATFLAYTATASYIKKSALFALGFIVFTVMNILRITTIISIGYFFGEEIAMLIFHNFAGWILILAGMLLTLLISEKLLHIQITPPPKTPIKCSTCTPIPKTTTAFCPTCNRHLNSFKKPSQKFWAKLLLILLGSYLVTLSIQAPTFAVAQGPQALNLETGWENEANIFPTLSDHELQFFFRDAEYEKVARQDAALLYAYLPNNYSKPTIYVNVNVASTISNLHSWEVCLITWQTSHGQFPLVTVLDSKDIQLIPDPPIVARYLVFESPLNYTQITLYWYEKVAFHTGLTIVQRYVRLSLIILTSSSTNYPIYEETLLNFGEAIALYWEPLKTQSLVSLGIPMQQTLLILSIAFIAITKTAETTNEWRKKTGNIKLFNRLASPSEKLLLQTIQTLNEEKTPATIQTITSTLAKKRKPTPKARLINNLSRLEEYGLIKKDVTNIQGNPTLVWKT